MFSYCPETSNSGDFNWQPSWGGVKRFDPTTAVKVTHRFDACNQKKTKINLCNDSAETNDWRGFQVTQVPEGTPDAGAETKGVLQSETSDFQQNLFKVLTLNKVRVEPTGAARAVI